MISDLCGALFAKHLTRNLIACQIIFPLIPGFGPVLLTQTVSADFLRVGLDAEIARDVLLLCRATGKNHDAPSLSPPVVDA
jgi:hypothetical protein